MPSPPQVPPPPGFAPLGLARFAPKPPQCPTKGPGRYEGEEHPCLTQALDTQTEWADETAGDSSIDVHRALFGTAADLASGLLKTGEGLCPHCAAGLALLAGSSLPHQALVEESGQGFVSLRWVSPEKAKRLMEEADAALPEEDGY